MNRYPHLDTFAFIGTQSKALPHSACNGLLRPQPLFTPPRNVQLRSTPGALSHEQAYKTSAMSQLPVSIGPFKLHKHPPTLRLPSSRCI
jgi:hypothetical protein